MLDWKVGKLLESNMISKDIRSMVFSIPEVESFFAGQHFDFRLTAPDGYQAQRSYSIASAPSNSIRALAEIKDGDRKYMALEFGIQILPDGEVSSYLDRMPIGSELEIKGPLGGHFIWHPKVSTNLVLVGGGSGIVPLLSIAREFVTLNVDGSLLFIISVKSLADLAWKNEILMMNELYPNVRLELFLTQEWPQEWPESHRGRINQIKLETIITSWQKGISQIEPESYVCGRNSFVESVTSGLVQAGLPAIKIRAERYG